VNQTPLGPGSEFDIIRRILKDAASPGPQVALASGDDCALINKGDGGYLAVSVDLSVQDAHFVIEWGTPELIGERAVRAAHSDVAAMAAQPFGTLVSLNVPGKSGPSLAERVAIGCRAAAEQLGAPLIGGDLSHGGASLVVDVVALGVVEKPLLRSGARPGDEIWVTGELGAAAAAVRAWKAGESPTNRWRRAFWEPGSRIGEAVFLAEAGASAAIDLSDGLLADAAHIAAASGVGIEIDWDAVPAAENVETELALAGGEDYELLVAVPGGILNDEKIADFASFFGIPLSRVGRTVSGSGVRVFRDDAEVELDSMGFDHFVDG
jgi:thiamine-monophosphate kinase